MAQPGGFAELSRTLLRAYAETAGIVGRFRETAGMLDSSGIDKLQQMHGRLREVTSATETATTDILDGLAARRIARRTARRCVDARPTPNAIAWRARSAKS